MRSPIVPPCAWTIVRRLIQRQRVLMCAGFLLSYASAVVYFVLHNLVATAACMKMTIHGMVRSTALRVLLSLTFQCNRSDVPSGAQVQQECCCPHARTKTAKTHPAEIARDGYSIRH